MSRTVLLLFGGESTEHEISVVSARNVFAALQSTEYTIILGYIDRKGLWWKVNEIDDGVSENSTPLEPQLGRQLFRANEETLHIDVILPILHGANGEDGSVQALAQLLHIPVVGCDMTSSAVSMSKRRAKQIVSSAGIPVVDYVVHHIADEIPRFSSLTTSLGSALFVKPDGAGSSVGVSRATNQEELQEALVEAHKHDVVALIESGLDHPRELEIAILGNYPHIQASAVAEIRPGGEFYSYESKYDSASISEVVIPADISGELSEQLRQEALSIFELLGCSGMARIDFFYDGSKIYFNEINTIPGFTNISVYPKAWEQRGISYEQLVSNLIDLAR